MNVEFSLYKGFLIADYHEDSVKAYRSRSLYADNIASYEDVSPADIHLTIGGAGDYGDFTESEYNKVMQILGKAEPARYEVLSAERTKEVARYMESHSEAVSKAMWDYGLILAIEQEGFAKSVKIIMTDWLSVHP